MENIIKVKLGDIKSRHLHYSMESLLGNEKVNIFKVIIECLFILLFGLVWVLFTILFHKRCFHFFKKYIKSDYINPITYETLGNGIFSRTISIIISLFLLLFTFPLIISKIMDNLKTVKCLDCNSTILHESAPTHNCTDELHVLRGKLDLVTCPEV